MCVIYCTYVCTLLHLCVYFTALMCVLYCTYVCTLLHLYHENKEAVWATCAWISLEDIIDFHGILRSVVQSVPHILVTAYFIELSRDQKPTGL